LIFRLAIPVSKDLKLLQFHNLNRRNFMPGITIAYGGLMILLGFFGYGLAESKSLTALIPTFAGIIFVVLGLLAFKPSLRRELMHVAVVLGLLATLASIRGFMQILAVFRDEASGLAVLMQILMGVLSGIYVGLCVRSFVNVRRERKKAAK
jgi:hypothetical protein